MWYHLRRTLTKAFVLAGCLALLLSLAATPSRATAAAAQHRIVAAGATLTLSGPDVITTNGNYSYHASFVVPYSYFYWYNRFCPTLTVASCTTSWSAVYSGIVTGQSDSTYTTQLTRDCTGAGTLSLQVNGVMGLTERLFAAPPGAGTRSFQVKVVAGGFGTPAQTQYKATRLCPDLA